MKFKKEKIVCASLDQLFKKLKFKNSSNGLVRSTAFGNLYIKGMSFFGKRKTIIRISTEFEKGALLDHHGIESLIGVSGRYWDINFDIEKLSSKEIVAKVRMMLCDVITGTNKGKAVKLESKPLEPNDSLDMDSDYNQGLNLIHEIFNQSE
jgi:hypothetical protein